LKALDVEFMRALHDRVNLVPVIAKADTMTVKELEQFKQNVLSDIAQHKIHLYEFPDTEGQGLPAAKGDNASKEYRKRIPFAVIGSDQIKEIKPSKEKPNERNRRVRVREYPWGTVEVENLVHNDFLALRDLVVRKNLIDLIEVTKNVHYENFRIRQMSRMPLENDPFTQMERQRKDIELKAEETRNAKERIFREKVAEHEKKIAERTAVLDAEEEENMRKINEKRAELEKLRKEITDCRGR